LVVVVRVGTEKKLNTLELK